MKSLAFFLTATAALTFTTPAFAEFWSEFRGPGQMGHSEVENVPTEWSATDNVAWKIPVPGKGWSSPVVVGSRVFLTTAVESGSSTSLRALAFNSATGNQIFSIEVFRAKKRDIHKKNSHASPTPVYEDGKLYVHFGPDGTACLDANSGRVEWRQEDLTFPPVHGNGGSPVIVGDRMIFSCDGAETPYVAGLDKKSGVVMWKTPRDVEVARPFSFSTPLAMEINGKQQVVIPGSGAVMAYDPEFGKEIWRFRYGEGYSVVPRPVLARNMLFFMNGFSGNTLFAIAADGDEDITLSHLIWKNSKNVPKESSCIIVDDLLYMNDDKGVLSCLGIGTGGVPVYQERLAGGNYSASPIYAGGHLYFHSGEGVTTVIKPGRFFKKVAENDIGEFGLSSFGVADGALFIRTESSLFKIGN